MSINITEPARNHAGLNILVTNVHAQQATALMQVHNSGFPKSLTAEPPTGFPGRVRSAARYGGMDASLMAKLKQLETENQRLKKMYAEYL